MYYVDNLESNIQPGNNSWNASEKTTLYIQGENHNFQKMKLNFFLLKFKDIFEKVDNLQHFTNIFDKSKDIAKLSFSFNFNFNLFGS